jgi:hypothetical protein
MLEKISIAKSIGPIATNRYGLIIAGYYQHKKAIDFQVSMRGGEDAFSDFWHYHIEDANVKDDI